MNSLRGKARRDERIRRILANEPHTMPGESFRALAFHLFRMHRDLQGVRVHFLEDLPEECLFPLIALSKPVFRHRDGVNRTTLQVGIYARTIDEAEAMERAVRDALLFGNADAITHETTQLSRDADSPVVSAMAWFSREEA